MKIFYYYLLSIVFFACLLTACTKSGLLGTGQTGSPDPSIITITGINPTTGGAGSPLFITGTNFSANAGEDTVKFNGVKATIVSASTTVLAVIVPTSTTGPVSVKVKTATVNSTVNGPTFTYTPVYTSIITVTGISPLVSVATVPIVITGTNFSTVLTDNVVKFNGVPATVTAATASSLTVTTPVSTTGPITVKVGSNAEVTGPVFTYQTVVTSLSPAYAKIGQSFDIIGTDFLATGNVVGLNTGSTSVFPVTATTSTKLTVSIPATATSGNISVKSNNNGFTIPTTLFITVNPADALDWRQVGKFNSQTYISEGQIATAGEKVLASPSLPSPPGTTTPSLVYSTDGSSFTDVTANLPVTISKIGKISSNAGSFYVSTDKGLLSTSDGNTWTMLFNSTTFGVVPGSVSFAGSTMYLATSGTSSSLRAQFYTSTNNGASWTKLSDLPFGGGTVVRTANGVFYGTGDLLQLQGGVWVQFVVGLGMHPYRIPYKSTDGITWTATATSMGTQDDYGGGQYLMLPVNNTLYGAIGISHTNTTTEIVRSSDAGVTWQIQTSIPTSTNFTGFYVNGSTVLTTNVNGRVYITNDDGSTYQSYGAPVGVSPTTIAKSGSFVYIIGYTSSGSYIFRAPAP